MSRGRYTCRVCGADFHDHCVNMACVVGYSNVYSINPDDCEEDCEDPMEAAKPIDMDATLEEIKKLPVSFWLGLIELGEIAARERAKRFEEDDTEYVLVDLRSVVGNCVMFWQDGGGYTCELADAKVFTAAKAFQQHEDRPSVDQPIPLSIARQYAVTHVSCEALSQWVCDNPDKRRIDSEWIIRRRQQVSKEQAG